MTGSVYFEVQILVYEILVNYSKFAVMFLLFSVVIDLQLTQVKLETHHIFRHLLVVKLKHLVF